jgi:drug/metabolite transporter (DMT)-like permease
MKQKIQHQQQHSKIWIILIALWIINGSSFLAIKVSIDTIPPLLSGGIRFLIAGSILFSIYLLRKSHNNKNGERIGWRQWRDTIVLGALLLLGGQGLLTWGTQYLASGISGLLNSTIPLWVAILALLILKKHMSKLTIIGLTAGFSGLMLLVAPSLSSGELDPIGTAALIISSIFWALGSLYSSRAKLPVSMIASSGMLMISGGLVITGVSFALGEYRDFDLLEISGQSLGALIYLIVIITIVGFTDFYWLLRVTTPSLANTFAYVSPVIAVILGALLLHEPVTIMTIIAMSVILVGVALMVTTTGKEDKKEEEKKKKIQK